MEQPRAACHTDLHGFPSSVSRPKSLRILSLDGGGVKGYTSLLILQRVFRQLGQLCPDGKEPLPCEVFDLIVGTSTGGIIATMLGKLHMSIDDCLRHYENVGKQVFGKRQVGGRIGRLIKAMTNQAFFDIKTLQSEVKNVIRSRQLPVDSEFCDEEHTNCRVMLCVTRVESRKSDVLRTYRTYASSEENYSCKIWEATSATAAAPIYFEPVVFEKYCESWCDGGLRRNNPINEALAEINRHSEFLDRQVGCLVSIGTGVSKLSKVSANLAAFLVQAVDMMTDSEEIADTFAMSQAGQDLAKTKRYFRFSVPQGLEELLMDEYKATEKMKAMTSSYLRKSGPASAVTECARSLFEPDLRLNEPFDAHRVILPYRRSAQFISRNTYIELLNKAFNSSSTPTRFVLWGTGGMGKTQIALDYALMKSVHSSVFWIRSDQRTSYCSDFGKVLQTIQPFQDGSAQNLTDEEILTKAREALRNLKRVLLVLDNVDQFDNFFGKLSGDLDLSSFLPSHADILITTRDPRFLGSLASASQGIRVSPMEDEEALILLKSSIPKHLVTNANEQLIPELLEDLGNLPLAVCQAAANIRELQIPLGQYIEAYRDKKNRAALMEEPVHEPGTNDSFPAPQSILLTWELSFEHLENSYPNSAYCLNVMALFHWRNIPSTFLRQLPGFEKMSEIEFLNVVKQLLHLSLIDDNGDTDGLIEYSLHPLVHERVLARLYSDQSSQISYLVTGVVNFMAIIFPSLSQALEENEKSEFEFTRYLIPHAFHQIRVLDCLNYVSKAYARLLQMMGRYFELTHQTRLAVKLGKQATSMSCQVWENGEPSRLYIRTYYAGSLNANAEYAEAKKEATLCLDMLQSPELQISLGDEKCVLERINVLHHLRGSLEGLHDYQECVNLIQQQIGLAKKAGFYGKSLWKFRHVLATSLAHLGRLDEAHQHTEALLLEMKQDPESTEQDMYFYGIVKSFASAPILKNSIHNNDSISHLDTLREQFALVMNKFSLRYDGTWSKAITLLNALRQAGEESHLVEAVNIAEEVLVAALASELNLEGQLLETFGAFTLHLMHLIWNPFVELHPSRSLSSRLKDLRQLFETLLKRLELSVEYFITRSPSIANVVATDLQHRGEYADAEKLHKYALKILTQERKDDLVLEGALHYNIMLAIAQQYGRLGEAWKYRSQHLHLLKECEELHGDFDDRLHQWSQQQELYKEAKERIVREWNEEDLDWYNDHMSDLNKAQRRLGWLDVVLDNTTALSAD